MDDDEDASSDASRAERDDRTHTIGSRRYNILNEEDVNNAINNMASDIELLAENEN